MTAVGQLIAGNARRQQELSGFVDAAKRMSDLSDMVLARHNFSAASGIANAAMSPILSGLAEQTLQTVQTLNPVLENLTTAADRIWAPFVSGVTSRLLASFPQPRVRDSFTVPVGHLSELMRADFLASHHAAVQRLVDSLPRFDFPDLTVQFPLVTPAMLRTMGEAARFADVIEGWAPTRDRLLDLVVQAVAHEAEQVERVLTVEVYDTTVLCPRCFTPIPEGRIFVASMDGCTTRPLLLCHTCSN